MWKLKDVKIVAAEISLINSVPIRIKFSRVLTKGSLSTCAFETQTATGREVFSLLTWPHTTTFTLLSIFAPLEMSSIKVWETIRS